MFVFFELKHRTSNVECKKETGDAHVRVAGS